MDLKAKAIEKIARQLNNLSCEYMIVPDGDPAKAITSGKFVYHKKVAHGEYTKYVASYIDNLKPGESVVIPAGDYPLTSLQSTTSAYAFRTFGKGNYMSSRTEDETGIELLCLDRDDTGAQDDDIVMREA